MKNLFIISTFVILTISCIQQNSKTDQKETQLESEERVKAEPSIELSNLTQDSASTDQVDLINDFYDVNRDEIIEDFKNFWGFDIEAQTYHFEVLNLSVWMSGNSTYANVKLSIRGQSEKSSGTAFNDFVFNLNGKIAEQLFETGFFQPECGSPEITIQSLSYLTVADSVYPVLVRESKWYPCCEQASELQIDWLVFSDKYQNQLTTLEKFYHNDNLMDCGPENPPPPESRRTNYFLEDSGITAVVDFYKNDVKTKSEKRSVSFEEY